MSQVVRRSSRIRVPPNTFTPTKGLDISTSKTKQAAPLTSNTTVPYKLNKVKAATQKMEASTRTNFKAEIKSDNLIIEFSAAMYEEFKSVLKGCLTSKNIIFTLLNKKDENGYIVEESMSVKNSNNKQLYRINCYHTSTRVLVNGSDLLTFVTDIMPEILDVLKSNQNFKELNKQIYTVCNEYVSAHKVKENNGMTVVSCNKHQSGKSHTTVNQVNGIDIAKQHIDNNKHSSRVSSASSDIQTNCCPICNRSCSSSNSLECSICLYWFHHICLKLTKPDIDKYENDSSEQFICSGCKHLQDFIDEEVALSRSTIEKEASENAISTDDISPSRNNKHSEIEHTVVTTQNPPISNNDSDLTKQNKVACLSSTTTAARSDISTNSSTINTTINTVQTLNPHSKNIPPVSTMVQNLPNSNRTNYNGLQRKKDIQVNEEDCRKKLKSTETKLGKTESELEQTKKQLATAKAYIVKLENKCKEFEDSNRILRSRLLLSEDLNIRDTGNQSHESNQHKQCYSKDDTENQKLQLLLQEQRIRQLEMENIRNTCRMDTFEQLMNFQNKQPKKGRKPQYSDKPRQVKHNNTYPESVQQPVFQHHNTTPIDPTSSCGINMNISQPTMSSKPVQINSTQPANVTNFSSDNLDSGQNLQTVDNIPIETNSHVTDTQEIVYNQTSATAPLSPKHVTSTNSTINPSSHHVGPHQINQVQQSFLYRGHPQIKPPWVQIPQRTFMTNQSQLLQRPHVAYPSYHIMWKVSNQVNHT